MDENFKWKYNNLSNSKFFYKNFEQKGLSQDDLTFFLNLTISILEGEPQDGHLMQQQNQVLSDQKEALEIEQQELGTIHTLRNYF